MTPVGLCVCALGLATRRGALVIAMELMRVRRAVGGGGAVCFCLTFVYIAPHGRARLPQLLFPFVLVLVSSTLHLAHHADGAFGLGCASAAPFVPTMCFGPPSVVAGFAAALEPWLSLPIGSALMSTPSILLAVEPLPSVVRWLCPFIYGSLAIGTLTLGVVRLSRIMAYRSCAILLVIAP